MTPTEAVFIAEGVTEPKDEAHYLSAWQLLVDTGLCWQLQGWYGRTANMLIARGHINP
jgi:hypothetical protein